MPPQRKMVIGATEVNTGEFVTYYENTTGQALINAVVASAAVPAVFPFEEIGNY